MTNFVRRLLIVAAGLLGALFAWPLAELCVAAQGRFPSYLLYSAAAGIAAGGSMGAFFASTEGLLGRAPGKAASGALQGLALGAAGGILGSLAAQALLFLFGESLIESSARGLGAGFVLARATGWAVVGCAIGASEGLRARSAKKALLGVAGGLGGGFAGGLLFVWAGASSRPGRLAALLVMGGLIGLLYSLLERRFAAGTFKALNGPLKGKEFLVSQRRLSIGSEAGADIALRGYRDVAPTHAAIKVERGGAIIVEKRGGKVSVNDREVQRARLELDDVVRIGSAKFLYGYFG